MKKTLLSLVAFCMFWMVFARTEPDERGFSYGTAKSYYINKDYVNAYKYFLIYKYSHFDNLQKSENQKFLTSLNAAINFCETRITLALSQQSSWEGHAWSESEKVILKSKATDVAPTVLDNHP